jgi:hypothetical protein
MIQEEREMSTITEFDEMSQQLIEKMNEELQAQKLLRKKMRDELKEQKKLAEQLKKEEIKKQNLIERRRDTLARKLERMEACRTPEGRQQVEDQKQAKRDRHEALRQKGEHTAATLYPDCTPIRISNGNIAQPGTAVGIMVRICTQHHGPKPHVSSGKAVVRHTCANDSMGRNGFVCGNPHHIEWSTQRQNFLDAVNGPHSNVECPHCGTQLKVNALGFHLYHNHPHLFKSKEVVND